MLHFLLLFNPWALTHKQQSTNSNLLVFIILDIILELIKGKKDQEEEKE